MSEPIFRIENLHKTFGTQKVLDGISFDIEPGESIVIIGQSGTGKSVLLKHLLRLMEPDEGAVYFKGKNLADMRSSELVHVQRSVGMLFQSAALFDSLSVAENVGLGLKESERMKDDAIEPIVREKLELVGLSDAYDKYPSELSGGMRKRAGLARAIANQPEVLLYDEPTTGLDPITADMIDSLIVRLNERLHVTSISVTHDMKSAFRIADRVIMLYNGKIECDCTPDEVRNTENEIVRQFITGTADGPIKVR